jgi:transketolase
MAFMGSKHERPTEKIDSALVRRLANTVRGLSIDATNQANSGHPGLPLGAADFAVTLWYYFLRYNPDDPNWPGRDKFILSAGHGSMLIYSLLHLAGFDLSLEDLKRFRQWESKTPGHPESFMTPGVETTTGPLGQGFATGVGFGLADAMLAARINRDGFAPLDNFVYALVSDGDLMEGVALEAASFAGHMKLGNLIYLYDDNDISLDGPTSLIFSHEDTLKKFEAMGWHVQQVDGHDPEQVAAAIVKAQDEKQRPSLISCKTKIGYGSPKEGTSGVHGSPLGEEAGLKTKQKLGISEEKFHVPQDDRYAWAERRAALQKYYNTWQENLRKARDKHADAVELCEAFYKQELPADLSAKLPKFEPGKTVATRKAGQAVLKALAPHVPWLVGGSADLSVSTNAIIDTDGDVQPGNLKGRHLFFGVREHAMGAIVNGLVRHGAFRAFGATFLTFSDYMRGAIRLGALMKCPSIFVFTHDSIFLGEDGPTHQSIEHIMAMRLIPNLYVFRPGDAIEVGESWVAMLKLTESPSAVALSRQNLPVYDRSLPEFAAVGSLAQGGYVFRKEKDAKKLDGILIATGSELHLCVEAARHLEKSGKSVRVVSLPCWELFAKQDRTYRDQILPPSVTVRVGVEAGVSSGWERWVGPKGTTVTTDHFGTSAPAEVLAQEYGYTPENVVAKFLEISG